MIALPITSTIAALLALILFPLTLQVSMRRAVLGRGQGDVTALISVDGGDDVLQRRMRPFGNFIEYVPTCLVLIALAELANASSVFLWWIGGLLIGGRVLHALGMLYADSPGP